MQTYRKVKPELAAVLHEEYRDFCLECGFDGEVYPMNPHAIDAFCQSLGIGRKSRKGRKQRQRIKDALCRPARLRAGKAATWGPPKGLPDKNGCRDYYILDECRRGGRQSGAVRRFNVRKRDRAIRCDVHKRGLHPRDVARRHGVSLRTVYVVLKRPPFARGPKDYRKHDFRDRATNILRQAGEGAGAVPGASAPAKPPYARAAVALKLHWVRRAQTLHDQESDPRRRSMRLGLIRRTKRALGHYGAAVRRADGQERWRLVRDASIAWLDELMAALSDPVPTLLSWNQYAGAVQRARRGRR